MRCFCFFKYHYEHMDLNVFDVFHVIGDTIPVDAEIVSFLASRSLVPFWLLSPFDMTPVVLDNFLSFRYVSSSVFPVTGLLRPAISSRSPGSF